MDWEKTPMSVSMLLGAGVSCYEQVWQYWSTNNFKKVRNMNKAKYLDMIM